jgi:hypothetical protein
MANKTTETDGRGWCEMPDFHQRRVFRFKVGITILIVRQIFEETDDHHPSWLGGWPASSERVAHLIVAVQRDLLAGF